MSDGGRGGRGGGGRPGDERPADEAMPTKVVDGKGKAAEALRRYLAAPAPDLDGRGWVRLERVIDEAEADRAASAVTGRRRFARPALALVTLGAAVVAGVGLRPAAERGGPAGAPRPPVAHTGEPPRGGAPAARRPAPSAERGPPAGAARGDAVLAGRVQVRRLDGAGAAAPLAPGLTQLGDEALVRTARGSSAEAVVGPDRTEVRLAEGTVDLIVAPRAAPRPFEVSAPPYRFVVLGTAFRVERRAGAVTLWVDEGAVGVFEGAALVARVTGGETWPPATGGRAAATARAPGAAAEARPGPRGRPLALAAPPPPGPPASTEPAGARADREPPAPRAPSLSPAPLAPLAPAPPGSPGEIGCAPADGSAAWLRCLEDEAAGTGLKAEAALLELAIARRDRAGDRAGALAALRTARARFPGGVLRAEVDLSIVELLPALGRHEEALEASARFLAEHPRSERAADVHLLRGNVYREALGDPGRAAQEYERAEAAAGPGAGRARAAFLRAVSLEAAGREEEAIAAYRRHLAGEGAEGPDADEARRRLARLLSGPRAGPR